MAKFLVIIILFSTLVYDIQYALASGVVNRGKNVMQSNPPTLNKGSKIDVLQQFATMAVDKGTNVISGPKIKIAVIGGGINTGLFSYYLHQLLKNAEIHIYNHQIPKKEPVENSSFVIHNRQKYMMDIVRKFELKTNALSRINRNIFMYDGLLNQLLSFDQNNFKCLMTEFIENQFEYFEKLYNAQEKDFKSWENLVDLINCMSWRFKELMEISTAQCLKGKRWPIGSVNGGKNWRIAHSLLLINYGQNLNSHAFAGLTSIIFSEISGKLMTIETPAKEIIRKLRGSSDRFFNCNITKVEYGESSIQITIDNNEKNKLDYNYVVIGTPDIGNIEFSKFEKPITVCQNREMVFTKIKGNLKYSNGKVQNFDHHIMASAIANLKDGKFRLANKITDSEWNILADDEPLNVGDIMDVTNILSTDHKTVWPDYSNKECVAESKFVFSNRLYYLNAIEWASCLLEMKAIGARNVALLINYKEKLSRQAKAKRKNNLPSTVLRVPKRKV